MLISLFIILGLAQNADAAAMEAQYRACAKHYIPAEKCTPEIYQQLREKDTVVLDSDSKAAVDAANEVRTRLKNPATLQVRTAYVITTKCKDCGQDDRTICLEIGGENGFGGTSVDHFVRITKQGKTSWRDRNSFFAGPNRDAWEGACTNVPTPFHPSVRLKPGIDVTEKVNRALRAGTQQDPEAKQ